ncbi:OmpA family protein [Undibacterium sp. Jales W-56]|uniref:OmpA family protein n=1 Tax=Undibacterium sp. Jales W-56 TaxID=2897325 RepID=UPI0021D1BE28|nr:OmpA family protein [Undibacterium sp. Jales W-56]MCU6433862.1 OmpA family protein [Undibacterium sp. Jales W-56]
MKKTHFTPVLLAMAVFVSACSSMPTTTSLLDQTRNDYAAAQSNPKVASYAPLEMKQATDALDQANVAAANKDAIEKIDKLAYVAKQKIALTLEVAKQKSAEAEVANAGKERDQIRLDQRTNEANQAKVSADQAKLAAQIAQGEAADAQRQTKDAQARAAQLEAQLADLAAKKTERGMVITLGDVLFGTDMARLNPEGMRTAKKLADVLQQNPQRTVLVEGFTDSTGTAAHNQQLSERRAMAVRSALQEMGIAGERIALRGYGEAYPVAGNATAQDRQLNRRVEIVLSDASGKVAQR